MIWLSTVCPVRGPMCQRLARTARPSSMAPRMRPSSTSVRLARTVRGSRKSGTPLAMASTPVSALHPAEKALRTSRNVTALSPVVGSLGRAELRLVEPERVDEADGDDGQQADDEEQGRQQEGPSRLAEAAQVEHHDEEEDPEAERDGGAVQAREGGLQGGDAGRDGDGDGQRVVDDQRRRGDEAACGRRSWPGTRRRPRRPSGRRRSPGGTRTPGSPTGRRWRS